MSFLFEPNFVGAIRVIGGASFRDFATQAEGLLASRFNSAGQLIPAWSTKERPTYDGLAIVDTIMSLPIMIWGVKEMENPSLADAALKMASPILARHMRFDGSTYHALMLDPRTGDVVSRAIRSPVGASPVNGSCTMRAL